MSAQLTLDFAGGFSRHDSMLRAREWRRINPEAWAMLVEWAERDLEAGRRASIGFYAELLRRPEYHTRRVDGSPYVIDNSTRAPLVRLLIDEHPELAEAFETRRSKFDEVGAASTWGVGRNR